MPPDAMMEADPVAEPLQSTSSWEEDKESKDGSVSVMLYSFEQLSVPVIITEYIPTVSPVAMESTVPLDQLKVNGPVPEVISTVIRPSLPPWQLMESMITNTALMVSGAAIMKSNGDAQSTPSVTTTVWLPASNPVNTPVVFCSPFKSKVNGEVPEVILTVAVPSDDPGQETPVVAIVPTAPGQSKVVQEMPVKGLPQSSDRLLTNISTVSTKSNPVTVWLNAPLGGIQEAPPSMLTSYPMASGTSAQLMVMVLSVTFWQLGVGASGCGRTSMVISSIWVQP